MELIQNHLAINQFQAIASLLSLVMAVYSFTAFLVAQTLSFFND